MYNVIDCLVYMYLYVLVSFSDCHQLFSMRDLWMCHSILVENKFLSLIEMRFSNSAPLFMCVTILSVWQAIKGVRFPVGGAPRAPMGNKQ